MKNYPYVVVGAGAGGLVVAIGLTAAGKKALLIEDSTYGGDCTNFGCVPSKSLIASAEIAHAIKEGSKYGIQSDGKFNGDGALQKVRDIVASIREEEEPDALASRGIETMTGCASFVDANTLKVVGPEGQEETVSAKTIVLATGSHPFIPPMKGLEGTPFLTNETIFNLEKVPASMLFVGGGPIGSELAQAFARLGSKVTVLLHDDHFLPREEMEVREVIQKQFEEDGITLMFNFKMDEVTYDGKFKFPDGTEGEQLVIATGRRANIDKLMLKNAKIDVHDHGIKVDKYGRTSKKHIWAVGDCIGPPFFTHFAENQGRAVLKNLLLPWNKAKSTQPVPRVTFTNPEVASIGLTESDAKKEYGEKKIATYFIPMEKVDRAICVRRTEGFVKVITKKWSSKILGATIVAPRAGEMLMEISVAMQADMGFRKLGDLIHPYPIFSHGVRKAADLYFTQTILGALKRK